MSYTNKIIYGYGFLIPGDEIVAFDDDFGEEFLCNKYTIIVDNMRDCDYFFGLEIKDIEEGEVYQLPFSKYNHEEFMDMLNEYKKFFPNRSVVPHEYIISAIF